MRAIFVSYRRDDSEGEAGRLFADLEQHFGKTSVFMDVASITKGRDFRKVIDESVSNCGVLLAIIGKNWVEARDEKGNRRLDDPNDFVRMETAAALKRDIAVIPILVRGASMPRADQLPDDLKELVYRNGVELSHTTWDGDVQLLIEALDGYVVAPVKARRFGDFLSAASTATNQASSTGGRKPEKRSRRWLMLLITVAVVAIAGVVVAYSMFHRKVSVPNLAGMTLSAAEARLEADNLRVGHPDYQPNSQQTPNTIFDQNPKANERVQPGTSVDVILSKVDITPSQPKADVNLPQSQAVEIPNVIGMSKDVARQALVDHGLLVGTIMQEQTGDKPPDTVVKQNPTAGQKVVPNSRVSLTVSVAKVDEQLVPVPNVVGKTKFDAQNDLKNAGLVLGNDSEQTGSSVAPGIVFKQSPVAGDRVKKGSLVDISVAVTPVPSSTVAVPNVVKLSLEQAQSQLQNLGLKVTVTKRQQSGESNIVLEQSLPPNLKVERAAEVNLVVSEPIPAKDRVLVLEGITQKHNGSMSDGTLTWKFDVYVNGSLLARIPEHEYVSKIDDVPVNQAAGVQWSSAKLAPASSWRIEIKGYRKMSDGNYSNSPEVEGGADLVGNQPTGSPLKIEVNRQKAIGKTNLFGQFLLYFGVR